MIQSMSLRPACGRSAERIISRLNGSSRIPLQGAKGGHWNRLSGLQQFRTLHLCRESLSRRGIGSRIRQVPALRDYRKDDTCGFASFAINNRLTRSLSTTGSSKIPESKVPESKHEKKSNSNDNAFAESTPESLTKEKPSFRTMMRQYGLVFFGTYFTVYSSTLASLFLSVQSGHLDAMYIISLITGTSSPTDPGGVADPETIKEAKTTVKYLVDFLETYRMTRPVAPMVEENPWIGNLAIAWIAAKITEPIRFAATVALTPSVAKYFGYKPISTAIKNGPIQVVKAKKNETDSTMG